MWQQSRQERRPPGFEGAWVALTLDMHAAQHFPSLQEAQRYYRANLATAALRDNIFQFSKVWPGWKPAK
jgi:hypothetical protein